MKLLNCIISYNRYYYLRNTVESLLEYFRFGDTVVVDNGSGDSELLDYLSRLESRGLYVIRRSPDIPEHRRGDLYGAMNCAVDFARDGGYEYIQFVQDDMQFMWHDVDILKKVELIFDQCQDAAQVSAIFYKKIILNTPERLEYLDKQGCYYVKAYGMSDLGFVPVDLINKHGFRYEHSETRSSEYWSRRGYKLYALHSPVLAWIPWPVTCDSRGRRGWLEPPAERYYLKPLDHGDIQRLEKRSLGEIPYHEDYCLPWGWACLRPYWFTQPMDEYAEWIYRSVKRGRPFMVWWVSAGMAQYFVPPRRWVLKKCGRMVVRMLRGGACGAAV